MKWMKMWAYAMCLLWGTSAHAGVLAISGSGGLDTSIGQPWSGAEIAWHPSRAKGFEPTVRLNAGYAFEAQSPVVFFEGGFTGVIPEDEATVRLGLVGRIVGYGSTYPMPVQPGPAPVPDGPAQWGFVPGIMATLEFEWVKKFAFALGLKGGVGAFLVGEECTEIDLLLSCIEWKPGFIGGIYGRFRLDNGFHADLMVGSTSSLSIGYAFGLKQR